MKQGEVKINILGTLRALEPNQYVDLPRESELTIRVAVSNLNGARHNKELQVQIRAEGLSRDMVRVVRLE